MRLGDGPIEAAPREVVTTGHRRRRRAGAPPRARARRPPGPRPPQHDPHRHRGELGHQRHELDGHHRGGFRHETGRAAAPAPGVAGAGRVMGPRVPAPGTTAARRPAALTRSRSPPPAPRAPRGRRRPRAWRAASSSGRARRRRSDRRHPIPSMAWPSRGCSRCSVRGPDPVIHGRSNVPDGRAGARSSSLGLRAAPRPEPSASMQSPSSSRASELGTGFLSSVGVAASVFPSSSSSVRCLHVGSGA